MTNSWTGGQYSLFRALFGAHLFVQIVHLTRGGTEIFSNAGMRAASPLDPFLRYFPNPLFVWDSPAAVRSLLTVAAIASFAFAIGKKDRIAAGVLLYVGGCLFTRNPLIQDPGPFFVGALLVAHVLLPGRAYGSWDARAQTDPSGGWRMPVWLHRSIWIVLALGATFAGLSKLMSPEWVDGQAFAHALEASIAEPVETTTSLSRMWAGLLLGMPTGVLAAATWSALAVQLFFAPLALITRIRPWLWLVSLVTNGVSSFFFDVSQQSAGLMLLHGLAFDPGWIRPRDGQERTVVFYDGACGLCHRTVRFLLAEDPAGARFRFAPLDSEAFRDAIAAPDSGFSSGDPIPDSVLVRRPGEPMRARAAGALEIGRELGGVWRLVSMLMGLVPLSMLDAGYDFIARNRHRFFARPDEACPLVDDALRERFLA